MTDPNASRPAGQSEEETGEYSPVPALPSAPLRMAAALHRNRILLWRLTKREAVGRYRGSYLGTAWSVLVPMLMLAVYTFVFGIVMGARWPDAQPDTIATFAMYLFSGLIPFQVFSEALSRAPNVILGNPSYVNRVVFPLEVLPVSIVGSALFHSLLSVLILLAGVAAFMHSLSWTVLLLPFTAIPLLFLSLGAAWLLAALGVFVRDVGHGIGVLVTLLLFTTPILYPIEQVPERLRLLVYLNPLTSIVDAFRRTLVVGALPSLRLYAYSLAVSFLVLIAGFVFFERFRRSFADVM